MTTTLMAPRTLPWYNASTSLTDGLQTAEQALDRASLNWEIALKQNKYTVYEGGKSVQKKSRAFSVVRTDTWDEIGVVGKRYKTLSNARSFRFLDSLVGDTGAHFEAVGSQKGGSRVFIVMKLPETIKVLGHDVHNQYILFVTSHDGSLAVTATPTLVRISCTNMFRSLLISTETAVWKAHHLTNLEDHLADIVAVRRSLDLVEAGQTQFQELAERLVKLPIGSDDGDNEFYEAMRLGLPWEGSARDKLVDGVRDVWHTSPLIDERYTGWGLLNATTEYLDHHRNYRTAESRFNNVAFTLGATIERNLTRGLSRQAS